MSRAVFIDTGPLLARYLAGDQHHARAVAGWKQLERSSRRLVTSDHVLDEFLTLLGRRANYGFAAERGRALLASSRLEIAQPASDDLYEALRWFRRLADQRVSLTDCLSFVLMKARRIHRAFSFDPRFTFAGFELLDDAGA